MIDQTMNKFNKIFLLTVCVFFLTFQRVNAAIVSTVVDTTISCTASTVFFVTKYTLKTGLFITKKTAKGIKAISIGVFRGVKEAFISKPRANKVSSQVKAKVKHKVKPKATRTTTKKHNYNRLPPPPPVLNWVD